MMLVTYLYSTPETKPCDSYSFQADLGDANTFRALETAETTRSAVSCIGAEGGELLLDGCGISMYLPFGAAEDGSLHDVSVSLLDEAPSDVLKEGEYLASNVGISCTVPDPFNTEDVQLVIPHSTKVGSKVNSDGDIVFGKHDSSVGRKASIPRKNSERYELKDKDFHLFVRSTANWWIPLRSSHYPSGRRFICRPYLSDATTTTDDGRSRIVRVHIFEDVPIISEKVRLEERACSRHQCHPAVLLTINSKSPDMTITCNEAQELLATESILGSEKHALSFDLPGQPDSPFEMVDLTLNLGSQRMSFVVMSEDTMHKIDDSVEQLPMTRDTPETDASGREEDVDGEIVDVIKSLTVVQYYDLGVALGFSLRQLDIIQFKTRARLRSTSSCQQSPGDVASRSAIAMIGMWKALWPSSTDGIGRLKEVKESVMRASKQAADLNET